MDEPRKESSTSTVVTAFVIGAVVGGAIGFLLGRATIDKGEVPCPPCNIVKQNDGGRQVCRLIGQIADDWSGGPITLAAEMLPPGATSPTYTQSSCVDIVVSCAEAAKPSLRFHDRADSRRAGPAGRQSLLRRPRLRHRHERNLPLKSAPEIRSENTALRRIPGQAGRNPAKAIGR